MEFKIYAISEYILTIEFNVNPSIETVKQLQHIKNKLILEIFTNVLEIQEGLNSISLNLNPNHLISISELEQKVKGVLLRLNDEIISEIPNSNSHTIPVNYFGEDLSLISKIMGLSESEIIKIHTESEYTVGMIGFLPGFPYLLGLDSRLHLPRKTTPNASLKMGSVAIADIFTGIYPQDSPGGWHILGQTDFILFSKDSLSKLKLGDKVKFEAI